MCIFIAAFLYTIITIFNALGTNSALLEDKALPAINYEYVGNEEFKFVVSVGVFKDENYIHVCLAVMITGLNGITSGKCGHYDYYAKRAGLIQNEMNVAEENPTKLHVNTKRPVHFDPDVFYTVIRFIDFNQYLIDQPEEKRLVCDSNIGVIVLKKKVQFTRPVLREPFSAIENLPVDTVLTLIGWNNIENEISGENTLMKKNITIIDDFYCRMAAVYPEHYQFCVERDWHDNHTLSEYDLGAPVYWNDKFVGILVHNGYALVTIEAYFEKYIDEVIALTWIPQMKERKPKKGTEGSTSCATTT